MTRTNNMVFKWKTPGLYKVSAQEAGEELERISKTQPLTPETVVDESRPIGAPLHDVFEWDDSVAGELYRKRQAGDLIRNVVTVTVAKETKEPVHVRAFIHTKDDYKPLSVVIKSHDYREGMLKKALEELRAFQRKYASLSELSELFENISTAIEKIEDIEEAA